MYHVVIAVDADMPDPTRLAEAVASLPEAADAVEATVLNVFEEFDVTDAEGGDVDSEDLYDEADVPESAEAVRGYLADRGVSASVVRRHGEPSAEVLAEARANDADVIVIGGKKRSPVGKALFGSTAQSILLEADRPVTFVHTD